MRVLITGATGFIGSRLAAQFVNPVVLSRDPERARRRLPDAEVHGWDPLAGPPPADAFRGVEVVFNLLGEPIAKGRWNPAKLARIQDSRVAGTRHLVQGLAGLARKPRVLVSASAIGYYGNRGDEELTESSSAGADFLAGVCREWEAGAAAASRAGIRVVSIRNGIVLRREGGALAQMLPPFRLGLGGRLGSGRQWMSWIHLDDLLGLYRLAAEREDLAGPVNGVALSPVTNLAFTRMLGAALGRPAVFPVPAFAVKLAFGGVAEIMLGSQRVLPKAALAAGFSFAYPELPACLAAAVARGT